jgi:hypothetical protein
VETERRDIWKKTGGEKEGKSQRGITKGGRDRYKETERKRQHA